MKFADLACSVTIVIPVAMIVVGSGKLSRHILWGLLPDIRPILVYCRIYCLVYQIFGGYRISGIFWFRAGQISGLICQISGGYRIFGQFRFRAGRISGLVYQIPDILYIFSPCQPDIRSSLQDIKWILDRRPNMVPAPAEYLVSFARHQVNTGYSVYFFPRRPDIRS